MKNLHQNLDSVNTNTINSDIKANADVQSKSFIDRIADTLLCLGKGKYSVTDIADNCKLSISTTHRLLNILTGPGFTLYDPTSHQYFLGPLISQLAENPDVTHQFLIRSAMDEINRMSGLTEETISLNMLVGINMRALVIIQGKYGLRVHEDNLTNRQLIIPLGAGQKVLLSQLDDSKLNLVLKCVKILEDPLLDIEKVQKELKQISEQGYAITRGVRIPDVMSISVPVKNYVWPLAINILGPINRLESRVSTFTTELLSSAERISMNNKKLFQ